MAMAQLPEELIVEILVRLPVKSLLRFRCVSKPTLVLIDTSHFINSHLCNSSHNFNLRKLIFSHDRKFDVYDVNLNLEQDIQRPRNLISSSSLQKEAYVYGHCNGLLLLSPTSFCNRMFKLALWNPSTRHYRNLPVCPFQVPSDIYFHSVIGSGFGYDDSTNDYKALFIVLVKCLLGFEFQVWLYGLKSNTWRRVQNFPLIEHSINRGFPRMGYFCVDGSLHWLCTLHGFKSEIVSFDLRNETFSLMPQPDCSISSLVSTELHVLEGCLCISNYFYPPLYRTDLYIRKKDAVGVFTWEKLFSVSERLFVDIPCLATLKFFGYSKRRGKILLHLNKGHMISYDLNEKSFGQVEIDMYPYWDSPILCLESLVSVVGGA